MSHRPVTSSNPFCYMGGKPLLSINSGVPVADAMQHVSDLLECVRSLTQAVATQTGKPVDAFAAFYLSEMAKAVVDACQDGVTHVGAGQ